MPENTDDPDPNGTNPVHDPNDPPVPCVTDTLIYDDNAFVVDAAVPYNFTDDAKLPVDVTATHFDPVDPGFRFDAVNNAVFASSSDRFTVPVAQLLVGFDVDAEYAEYDAVDTTAADANNATGIATTDTIRTTPADGRPTPPPAQQRQQQRQKKRKKKKKKERREAGHVKSS